MMKLSLKTPGWLVQAGVGKADAVLAANIFHFGEYTVGLPQ